MHQTIVAASIILIVALVAGVWAHSYIAASPDAAKAGASNSTDIMQMMKKAKGLPEQNWPAH
jgi:hypothetical protein